MTDNEIIKAWDILCKLDFFNQRAGRELWNDKPEDIQNKDIEDFANDVQFLKDLINRLQAKYDTFKDQEEREHQYCKNVCEPNYKAEIERLKAENKYLEYHLDCECSINADLATIIAEEMVGEG